MGDAEQADHLHRRRTLELLAPRGALGRRRLAAPRLKARERERRRVSLLVGAARAQQRLVLAAQLDERAARALGLLWG